MKTFTRYRYCNVCNSTFINRDKCPICNTEIYSEDIDKKLYFAMIT